MKFLILLLVLILPSSAPAAPAPRTMLIVVSAPGEPEFASKFKLQAEQWSTAARQAGLDVQVIGLDAPGETADRDALEAGLAAQPATGDELWLVLLGHGTFDGRDAKFALRGSDFTATDLDGWLKRFERPLVVLGFFAASAPFLEKIAAPNRVVVAATRSAGERNYSRLGEFAASALTPPEADLDGDGALSVLELTLHAARGTTEFYNADQRLVSEHAILDDNGDGKATEAASFTGLRAKTTRGQPADGSLARQVTLARDGFEQSLPAATREARAGVERRIEELRSRKETLKPDDYYGQLERLLLEMAALLVRPDTSS